MHYMPVPAEKYLKMKHESEEGEMMMPLEYFKPVDLNHAYVPVEVTQKSKGSDEDMKKAAECNTKRFGL